MAHLRDLRGPHRFSRLIKTAVGHGALAAVALALVTLPGTASASASSVTIASLNCEGTPEVVQLTNTGTESVDLTGWFLRSDPSSESFDLSPVGTVTPGASVYVNSGPGATGAFVWSTSEVFRNGDATDFAELLDANAASVARANCRAATPAANGIPDGGGPPAAASTLSIGLVAAAAGGALVALTVITGLIWMGAGVITRRNKRSLGAQLAASAPADVPAAQTSATVQTSALLASNANSASPQPKASAEREGSQAGADGVPVEVNLWPYILVVLGALAAALLILLAASGGRRKK